MLFFQFYLSIYFSQGSGKGVFRYVICKRNSRAVTVSADESISIMLDVIDLFVYVVDGFLEPDNIKYL